MPFTRDLNEMLNVKKKILDCLFYYFPESLSFVLTTLSKILPLSLILIISPKQIYYSIFKKCLFLKSLKMASTGNHYDICPKIIYSGGFDIILILK